jgi:hypothetical protein
MLSYLSLYQRYASERPDIQQVAKALDQSVARAALQAGNSPRVVTQLLAQGSFTQHQTRSLSPEAKKAALPGLLQLRLFDQLEQCLVNLVAVWK